MENVINISEILMGEDPSFYGIIDEAVWRSKSSLETHYDDHVLKPGEKFDPTNPKFYYMSLEEYKKRGEELSDAPALTYGECKGNYHNKTFGFQIMNFRSKEIRNIKIRTSGKYNHRFPELVIYSIRGEMISYMLLKNEGKILYYEHDFVSELEE